MKKLKISSMWMAAFMVAMTTQTNAKVWRVNNQTGVSADFSSVSTAISSASVLAGDTLYVEGSPVSYGTVTLSKKLVIIGTGYFLSSNDSTQAYPAASTFDNMTISSAAAGSSIIGIQISYSNSASSITSLTISANNILISHCYIYCYNLGSTYSSYCIQSSSSYVIIEKSFIYNSSTTGSPRAIYFTSGSSNLISNNIIKMGTKSSSGGSAIYMLSSSSSFQFINNVIIGDMYAYNSYIANNIQIIGSYSTSSTYPNTTRNNIGHSTQFGTSDGNKSNVTMTTVFTYGGSENYDNHYTLKTGSPAIGAGSSGEDCGAFGGNNPYILSGMPPIPAIFNATFPTTGTTTGGVNINIKAKAHD